MPNRTPRTNDWPRGFLLRVYEPDGDAWAFVEETTDRKYDLNDNLFQLDDGRTVFLGIEIHNPNWPVWDEGSIRWIQNRIVWDIEFDGNEVTVSRHTPELLGHPCTEEFGWKVEVTG